MELENILIRLTEKVERACTCWRTNQNFMKADDWQELERLAGEAKTFLNERRGRNEKDNFNKRKSAAEHWKARAERTEKEVERLNKLGIGFRKIRSHIC